MDFSVQKHGIAAPRLAARELAVLQVLSFWAAENNAFAKLLIINDFLS